jgi:segregation and condensation protein A
MSHTVAVDQFEGPLGLLLELVEKGRLAVTAISVAEITAGYLERVQQLDAVEPEELAEFVELGARLVHIKSLALLPQSDAGEQAEELRQLNLELAEYRRYQSAARELAGRTALRSWRRSVAMHLPATELPLPSVELPALAEAFRAALKRVEAAPAKTVLRPMLSLEEVIGRLRRRLGHGSLPLQEIIDNCHDRLEIIATFLAVLEVVHNGTARVTQGGQFDPIILEATGA